MLNAVGAPQRILIVGGTSDIALAVVKKYLERAPLDLVLAARSNSARREAARDSCSDAGARSVRVVDFDAHDLESHEKTISDCFSTGDIDIAIVAFGVLPDEETSWKDRTEAVETATVNYTAAVSIGVLLGQRMSAQGHGNIVALSSVAGEFVRPTNFVYGSSKAGFDGFYRGLGSKLAGLGVHVMVVRPGQVRTTMTQGRDKEAPFTTDTTVVAERIIAGLAQRKELLWSPQPVRYLMSVLRHIPTPVMRKLPI